ncbi:hypothetical protein ACFLS5_05340 [Candidatus Bipolaricaulota bacterium]
MMEDRYIPDALGDNRLSIHTLFVRRAAAEREEGNSLTKRRGCRVSCLDI